MLVLRLNREQANKDHGKGRETHLNNCFPSKEKHYHKHGSERKGSEDLNRMDLLTLSRPGGVRGGGGGGFWSPRQL